MNASALARFHELASELLTPDQLTWINERVDVEPPPPDRSCPFEPGDRIKRRGIISYRQLSPKKTHCVRDCVQAGCFNDGRPRWLVGIVGIDAKGYGTEEGRFWAWQIELVRRIG